MASSEENPTAAEEKSTGQGDSSEGGEAQSSPSGRSKKKTMLGLGKLRESLKKSSAAKKGGSLRIPKPASRKRKKTSLGLPRPATSDGGDAGERKAPKKRTTLNLDPDAADEAVDDGPPTDRIDAPEETTDEALSTDRIDAPEETTDEELSTDRIDAPEETTDEALSTDRIDELEELDVDDLEVVEDADDAASTDRIEETSEVDELDVDDLIEVDADDDGPATDRIDGVEEAPSTDQMSATELGQSMPHLATPGAIDGSSSAGQAATPDDSGLIEDVELDPDDVPAEPMAEEATMLSDSPFGAQPADAVGHAEGSEGFGAEPADKSTADESTGEEAAGNFGAESTVITDSVLGGDQPGAAAQPEAAGFGAGKTTVSQADDSTNPSSHLPADAPQSRSAQPNPPTPEQKPRGANFSAGSAPSPGAHSEAALDEDSDVAADDFHAEKTEVFDSPYENEALVPRLSSLSGPAAGQEFLLNKQRNTIGRGKNNTIMIADLAMSRQHFEIVENNDQTYTIIDLQSANGTQLNNTRIEEAELLHGDRLEAGKTEFQFVIPGDRPTPRSQHRRIVPKRDVRTPGENTMVGHGPAQPASLDDPTDKLLTVVIIGAGALSVVLFGVAIYLFFADGDEQPAQAQAPVVQASEAQARYLEGVEQVKARNWQAARAIFEDVAQMEPDFPGVDAQLVRVAREANTESTLEQAHTSFEDGDDQRAARLAMAISNESVYFEQAQQLLRQTRQRRIAVLYQQAQEAATAEELDEARAHIQEILEEVPNHKGALELRRSLDEEDDEDDEAGEDDEPVASAARPARASSDSDWLTGDSSSSGSRPASDGAQARVNFTRGFTLYKGGDFDDAAAHFRSIADSAGGSVGQRARRTADSIDKFATTYASASRAFKAGAWKRAIDGLTTANKLDRTVARSGYFSAPIHAKLGTAHGKVGLAAFEKGDYRTAHRHYTRGKRYAAGDSTVNTLRRSLSNQARSLYIQAANKKKTDPDQAAALCRQITQMVPASHSMHRKAKVMLEEL